MPRDYFLAGVYELKTLRIDWFCHAMSSHPPGGLRQTHQFQQTHGPQHFDTSKGKEGNNVLTITLPETNMVPENNPLEKEIPIGNHHF